MKIVFCADASLAIGAGHVMRVSAIAEEAIARGLDSVFIGDTSELPWVTQRINNLGFKQILSNLKYFKSNPMEDLLILDSYNLLVSNELLERSKWNKIIVISDEFTPNYDCDVRISPGVISRPKNNFETQNFYGPDFTPFRRAINKIDKNLSQSEINILVVGGGSDPNGFVIAVANILHTLQIDFKANLFVNNTNLLTNDDRFSIFPIGPALDEISGQTDLVFTTASTSSLEFLARGLVVAIGCSVENQKKTYQELIDLGVAAPIGEFLANSWDLNKHMIKQLVTSKILRAQFHSKSLALFDLKGAERIVNILAELTTK